MVARRKNELAAKLAEGKTEAPGWKDMVGRAATPAPEAADAMKRKTYLLSVGLVDRVAAMADEHHVGINELARYLLDYALTEVESGRHKLPTKAEARRRIVS